MGRKLVSIRKIKALAPIEGADFIELANVDGWQCIVKKGVFKEGDKGVFFEVDSMLPVQDRYAFLGKTKTDATGEGYRIRTMKMRGVLSQGLLLPFSEFDYFPVNDEGYDMTEHLGVWLYKRRVKVFQGKDKSGASMFPSFIPETDQERIQNLPNYFKIHRYTDWEITYKLNGRSMTVWNYDAAPYMKAGKTGVKWRDTLMRIQEWFMMFVAPPSTFGVCSRNVNLREHKSNPFWNMANELGLRELMRGHNVAIQGELIGPKIQDNHEKVERKEFYVFDIYDIDKSRYMTRDERLNFMERHLPGVSHVATFSVGTALKVYQSVESLQKYVTGPSQNGSGFREGLVFKALGNPAISFKCISNEYLLKNEE